MAPSKDLLRNLIAALPKCACCGVAAEARRQRDDVYTCVDCVPVGYAFERLPWSEALEAALLEGLESS